MPPNPYLHERSGFFDLIKIVADEQRVIPALVEKDYWIMHCLYGLSAKGFTQIVAISISWREQAS